MVDNIAEIKDKVFVEVKNMMIIEATSTKGREVAVK